MKTTQWEVSRSLSNHSLTYAYDVEVGGPSPYIDPRRAHNL
jgi:hypothetical protein